MARLLQTPMPPTPQNLMRRANTSRIARSLGNSGALPPIHQLPVVDQSRLSPPLTMPPTPSPAAMNYLALMQSAGRPVEHIDPMPPEAMGGTTSFEEPPLPIEPDILPGNLNPPPLFAGPPSPRNDLGIDPSGTRNDPDPSDYDPASGIGNSRPPTGNYFPTFGGGPYNPSEYDRGGRLGSGRITGGRESIPGMLLRRLPLPYGANLIPNLYHTIAERIRAGQRGQGRPGAPPRQIRGGPQQSPALTTGPIPMHQRPGTHWDFTQSRFVPNENATGAQFSSRAANALLMNSVARHQPTNLSGSRRPQSDRGLNRINPIQSGLRGTLGAEGVINVNTPFNPARVDPATAARLRAHAAFLTPAANRGI